MMWDIFRYGTASAYIGLPGMMADGGTLRNISQNSGRL